jgi:nucleoside-diphosphate-sugar epimerase
MQTILGSGGVIGNNLAKALTAYTTSIKLVSRHPAKVNQTDILHSADLLDAGAISAAVNGSEIVYLVAGLPYKTSIWQKQWPAIMDNVIKACKESQSKLVFFDNVYAYGKVNGWMTEETPLNPCSNKGNVRAAIASQLMDEVKKGNLQAMIVRAADFYGPKTPLSFITVMILEKLAKGKKAQLMLNDNTRHSLTFTPDAGSATALLGNTTSAYNQVWHAPTDPGVITGKEFVELCAKELSIEPNYQVLKKWMMQMAGLFVPIIRETIEMLYQNESDFLFSSRKFEKAFPDFRYTTYNEGVKASIADLKK